MSSKKRFRCYVFVGADEQQMSTAWHFWAHRTSFYLTNEDLGGLKVSLHGRDPRHPGKEHYRIEPVNSGGGLHGTERVALIPPRDGWPLRFKGQRTDQGDLVLRLRVTYAASRLSSRPAPPPQMPSSARIALPPHLDGWANDFELTFSQVPMGWYPANTHDDWITLSHAGTTVHIGRKQPGFMINSDDGAVLRGNSRRRWTDWYPTPAHLRASPEAASPNGRRVVAIDVDADGLLWVVEQAMTPASILSLPGDEDRRRSERWGGINSLYR
ncbi:hypothetical protein QUV83_04580 [Cellulomonas cellasea]|uniref:hypothetical protein n=1 Tax=Cellulomonas cellasea TaxID=43670 RepID=UPI0025A4B4B7|nr:hypothetical protein [Cellulomonas cellasea]MDM8084038.1 hypothetical protein [Cellulomonas cellasea]